MRVEIKQLAVVDGRPKWTPIPAQDLLGKSVIDYMLGTDTQVIACLFQDDKPAAFVSNHISLVDKYKEKGVSLHAREIKAFLGTTLVPPMIAYTFDGGGEVVEIRSAQEDG
jgi:hypothetical protein